MDIEEHNQLLRRVYIRYESGEIAGDDYRNERKKLLDRLEEMALAKVSRAVPESRIMENFTASMTQPYHPSEAVRQKIQVPTKRLSNKTIWLLMLLVVPALLFSLLLVWKIYQTAS